MKGRCLNRLTNRPGGSPSRTRTYDALINSQVFYRLNYRGIKVGKSTNEDYYTRMAIICQQFFKKIYKYFGKTINERDLGDEMLI